MSLHFKLETVKLTANWVFLQSKVSQQKCPLLKNNNTVIMKINIDLLLESNMLCILIWKKIFHTFGHSNLPLYVNTILPMEPFVSLEWCSPLNLCTWKQWPHILMIQNFFQADQNNIVSGTIPVKFLWRGGTPLKYLNLGWEYFWYFTQFNALQKWN